MIDHHYLDEWKASMEPVHENSAEEWLVERYPTFTNLLYKLTLMDQDLFPKGSSRVLCNQAIRMVLRHKGEVK